MEQIRDPVALAAALEAVRIEYNSVRLHARIGYIKSDYEQRGEQIRYAKKD